MSPRTPKKKSQTQKAAGRSPAAPAPTPKIVELESDDGGDGDGDGDKDKDPRTPTPRPMPKVVPWVPFLLVCVPAMHVIFAPYTKVEESFTLHAAHDVLRYGLNPLGWPRWDHREFPGAVPRSFVPPILLGIASFPNSIIMAVLGMTTSAVDVQQIVRLTLALAWAYSMFQLYAAVKKRFGARTSAFFVFISVLQFHVPFYAGRTLPNFTALPAVNLSIAFVLSEEYWRGIAVLTAAATVIRLELALMVAPLALNLVLLKRISFPDALLAGLAGGFGSLVIAAPIDYALWSPVFPNASLPDFTSMHALWPELSAMIYNVVDGNADNWGVMPRTYYIGALAKMLAGAFPLFNIACMWAAIQGMTAVSSTYENKHLARTVGEVVRVFGPGASILVAALSEVGHKEWRFIVYVVPIMNIVAAAGAAALWSMPDIPRRVLARLAVFGLLGLTAAFTVFSSYVSGLNYPGGEVWQVLNKLSIPEGSRIHFPPYALQTGASLFTFTHAAVRGGMALPHQQLPPWEYVKDENPVLLQPAGAWDNGIDYVVTNDWANFADSGKWKEVAEIEGYAGVRRGGKYFVEVMQDKKLAVLQRVD